MTDLFKEKSTNWDANEMRTKMSQAIGSSILENVKLNEQMTVMDFGAGTGLISAQVAPHVKKITAVDVSESMLQKLIAKTELKGKVEILCQDITLNHLGLPSESSRKLRECDQPCLEGRNHGRHRVHFLEAMLRI
jgi:SAM-dependent methyltransferase